LYNFDKNSNHLASRKARIAFFMGQREQLIGCPTFVPKSE
jgi:hypothetical protein